MKRSESVLVYGVTGVLGVILAIAIIFGGEPPRTPDGDTPVVGKVEDDGAIPFLAEGAVSDAERDFQALLEGGDPVEGSKPAATEPVDPLPEVETRPPVQPIEVPLARSVRLGVSRTEENPASGERFRFVVVKRGQSLPLLIQRWCPGTDGEVVAALNEDRDLARLHPGDEVCVPWVDDDILLAALDRRVEGPGPASPVRTEPVPLAKVSAKPATSTATTYTLKEGDSLWLVAKRRVGARKAQSYINAILATNPSIDDPADVSAGQRITLPN